MDTYGPPRQAWFDYCNAALRLSDDFKRVFERQYFPMNDFFKVMRSLPEKEATVMLTAASLETYEPASIASTLNKNQSTVRSQVSHAISRLHKSIRLPSSSAATFTPILVADALHFVWGEIERSRPNPTSHYVAILESALVVKQDLRQQSQRHVPFVVPLDITNFVGMHEDISLLREWIRQSGVIGLIGMTGIGKTTLAIHLAHCVRNEFHDGIFWLEVRNSSPDRAPPSTGQ